MLARFGSVPALARAHPAGLALMSDVGPARVARLAAAFALARRINAGQTPVKVATAEDVVNLTKPLLHMHKRERVVVVICNRANRVIGVEVLSNGSTDRALLPVRETVVAVLRRDG